MPVRTRPWADRSASSGSPSRTCRTSFYIEQLTSALYLDKPVEVDSYLEVMEQLCLQAEPVANTAKVLQQILADI